MIQILLTDILQTGALVPNATETPVSDAEVEVTFGELVEQLGDSAPASTEMITVEAEALPKGEPQDTPERGSVDPEQPETNDEPPELIVEPQAIPAQTPSPKQVEPMVTDIDVDIKEAAPQRQTLSPAEVHVRNQLQTPIMPQTVPDFTKSQAVPLTLDVQTGGVIEVDGVVAVGEVSMVDEVAKNRPRAIVLQAPVAAEHAPKVVQQLAVTMVQHKDQLTEIALDPPELGKVKMQLSITDGVAQVVLAVERPETNDLIRRHLDQLANELGALGYRDITFEFSDSNFGGQHSGNGDTATNDDPDIAETPQPKTIAVTSGLDIRL